MQVWVEFALIGSTSALTFMVAGVLKEIVTVLVAHFVYDDSFTALNGAGLAVRSRSALMIMVAQLWAKHISSRCAGAHVRRGALQPAKVLQGDARRHSGRKR